MYSWIPTLERVPTHGGWGPGGSLGERHEVREIFFEKMTLPHFPNPIGLPAEILLDPDEMELRDHLMTS